MIQSNLFAALLMEFLLFQDLFFVVISSAYFFLPFPRCLPGLCESALPASDFASALVFLLLSDLPA